MHNDPWWSSWLSSQWSFGPIVIWRPSCLRANTSVICKRRPPFRVFKKFFVYIRITECKVFEKMNIYPIPRRSNKSINIFLLSTFLSLLSIYWIWEIMNLLSEIYFLFSSGVILIRLYMSCAINAYDKWLKLGWEKIS